MHSWIQIGIRKKTDDETDQKKLDDAILFQKRPFDSRQYELYEQSIEWDIFDN